MNTNNKLIPVQDLQNKMLASTKNILGLSFEYLLASIAKLKSSRLDEFSQQHFDLSNILVNPFFVAISNGNSQSLFALFGEFYAFSFGPASVAVHSLLTNQEMKPVSGMFSFFKVRVLQTPVRITLLPQVGMERFDELINAIGDKEVFFNDGVYVPFKNIMIQSDNGDVSSIAAAIDKGIDVILKESNRLFFEGDKEVVLFKSLYFPKFKDAFLTNQALKLEYEDIKNTPEKPFPIDAEQKLKKQQLSLA